MTTRAPSLFSPAVEARLMDRAKDYGNQVAAEAIAAHGPLAVLVPLKKHWNAITGNEFAAGNQAALEAVALKRGFERREWASESAIKSAGGHLKAGEENQGARILRARGAYQEIDKLDADGNPVLDPKTRKPMKERIEVAPFREVERTDKDGKPVLNPESGKPDMVRIFDTTAKPLFYGVKMYNQEQTEGFEPKHRPLLPASGHRLPDAVKGVWDATKMELPIIQQAAAINYDMATDTLTLPPLESFKDPRPRTHAAFQLAKHLAYSAGHPSRLNLREFSDPDLYAKNSAHVEIAATGAAGMVLQNHSTKYDPMIVQSGTAEISHLSESLKNRSVDLHFAMAEAVKLYGFMTGLRKTKL